MCFVLFAVGSALAVQLLLKGQYLYSAFSALMALFFGALMLRNILKVRARKKSGKKKEIE